MVWIELAELEGYSAPEENEIRVVVEVMLDFKSGSRKGWVTWRKPQVEEGEEGRNSRGRHLRGARETNDYIQSGY